MLFVFGRLFTARELYDYFVNAQRLTLKKTHAWTNQRRQAALEQHHKLTGQWGLGRKTPIDSPDREVNALAEARQRKGQDKGKSKGAQEWAWNEQASGWD